MNHPYQHDYTDQPTVIEYKVINMNGYPHTSGVYTSAQLGDDALRHALAIQAARGGEILFRTITQTPWTPYKFDPS